MVVKSIDRTYDCIYVPVALFLFLYLGASGD